MEQPHGLVVWVADPSYRAGGYSSGGQAGTSGETGGGESSERSNTDGTDLEEQERRRPDPQEKDITPEREEESELGPSDCSRGEVEATEDEEVSFGVAGENVSNVGRGGLHSRAGGEPQTKRRKVLRCRRRPRETWVQVYVVRTLNDTGREQKALLVGQRHFGEEGAVRHFARSYGAWAPSAFEGAGQVLDAVDEIGPEAVRFGGGMHLREAAQ